jgi:glycosyltransferase involved in cell wall biosynthesis
MRIAITHPYCWPDVRRGGERIAIESAVGLSRRGHDVTIFTSGWRVDEVGSGVRTIGYRRRFQESTCHERWFGLRVLPALLRGRFDVVHSFMPYDTLAAMLSRRLSGNVVVYEELGNPFRWWWSRLRDRRARRALVHRVDAYVCVSHFSEQVLRDEWGRAGSVIPGGVNLSQFAPQPRREADPTILFSGALTDPSKRLDLLLEAVAILSLQEPRVRLWLSGPGDVEAALTGARPEARSRTTYLGLGRPDEQAERYGLAWVTALPSETDSFGLALLESLACGTPIVVTDRGAPQELIVDGTGISCPAGDPVALADGLAKGLELARRQETAARCRARAASYDWDDAVVPGLEQLYSELLRPRHRHGKPDG